MGRRGPSKRIGAKSTQIASESFKNFMRISERIGKKLFMFCSNFQRRTKPQHIPKEKSRRPISRVLSTLLQALDGHSSGTCFATRLARPTRATDRKYSRFHAFAQSRPPLFGLAPGGVYPASLVTKAAVRSYRPVSPFPSGKPGRRFVFCGTVPGVAPAGC